MEAVMYNLFKKLFLCWMAFVFISCASTDMKSSNQEDEEFSSEEKEAFLDEDEEDEQWDEDLEESKEQDTPIETLAENEESEEEQAQDEIEEIENEFSEFIEDEEEELAEDEDQPPDQEIPGEQLAENETVNPLAEEPSTEEGIEEETLAQNEADIPPLTDIEEQQIETEPPEETAGVDPLPAEEAEPVISAEDETTLPALPADNTSIETSLSRITDIRYESGNIYIDTVSGGEVSYRSRFNEATKQFIVEIPSAVIVDQLKWPYIMKEFRSDFALLQADQKNQNTVRIIVQMRPSANAPSIIQKDSGDGFIISSAVQDLTDSSELSANNESSPNNEVQDESFEESFAEEGEVAPDGGIQGEGSGQILSAKTIEEFLIGEQKFYGDPITLDIRDADIKDILYFLSEDMGINMIISDSIPSSKINLRLKNVPWDQVLYLIMKRKKLAYIRKNNVVTISTLREFRDEQNQLTQLINAQQSLTPLKLEIIPIAYAQAGSISSQINIFRSNRGKIQVDSNNNSLLVYDTEESIEDMKKLIRELDRTPKQVMIAAKIVEVSEDFTRNFGVSWGLSGAPFSITGIGNLQVTPAPLLRALPDAPDSGTLGSNLQIGTFKFAGDLDAQFGLAESEGQIRVLSSPRIMALNGQSASVNQSSESISFSAVTPEGGGTQTQIQRSPVNLSLSVTPQITNVDSIYMQVSMTRSFEGARLGQGESSAAPTNTRSANTQILVQSGQTAVIGGIYESEERESLLGLPILKYIPIVKWLFSKTNSNTAKRELLLFLTPRIVDWKQEPQDMQSALKVKKRRFNDAL